MSAQRIGRYEIRSEIGKGGMAVVLRAYDPQFGREVAIKVLPRELLHDPSFRARFDREARTLAALEHPAIVPVYDVGEDNGQPYLVMRLMTGGSLADRLEKGPLTLVEAARILTKLAPALDEAHSRGIVHRDLKPGNILFDQRGDPYVCDFGIVKLSTVRTGLTGHFILGTPAYMSPEQSRGDPNLDGRSDIYSLGAILFEMLVGQVPYTSDSPTAQMVKHITEPIPNLLLSRADLPVAVQQVIDRSMAKRREDRFATTAEMAALLAQIAGYSTAEKPRAAVETTRLPTAEHFAIEKQAIQEIKAPTRAKRKAPTAALLASAVVVILAAVGGFLVWGGGGEESPTRAPEIVAMEATASPTATLSLDGIKTLQSEGEVLVQLPGQDPVPLSRDAVLPLTDEVRLESEGGAKALLDLGGSHQFYLGENTRLNFSGMSAEQAKDGGIGITLEQGWMLLKGEHLLVVTGEGWVVTGENAIMGVEYDPGQGLLMVDCLKGACQVGSLVLGAGQRGGYTDGSLGLPVEAHYDPWLGFGDPDIPQPTATSRPEMPGLNTTPAPTPTLTATPTPTPPALASPRPTQPPYVAPTATKKAGKPKQPGGGKATNTPPPSGPKPTNTPPS